MSFSSFCLIENWVPSQNDRYFLAVSYSLLEATVIQSVAKDLLDCYAVLLTDSSFRTNDMFLQYVVNQRVSTSSF